MGASARISTTLKNCLFRLRLKSKRNQDDRTVLYVLMAAVTVSRLPPVSFYRDLLSPAYYCKTFSIEVIFTLSCHYCKTR